MLNQMFKSVLDQERVSVVICDLEHTIVYMNAASIRNYAKYGGEKLLGTNLMGCHNERSCGLIRQVVDWFGQSPDNNMVFTERNEKQNKDVYMVALRDENKKLIGYYEKHEMRNPETASRYDFSKSLC